MTSCWSDAEIGISGCPLDAGSPGGPSGTKPVSMGTRDWSITSVSSTMVIESRRGRWMCWGGDRWDGVTWSRLRRRDQWVMKCWGSWELLLPDSFHQSPECLKLFLVLLQLHLHPCIITLEEENILVSILLHLCHVLLQTGYLVLQHVSIGHARCLHTRWGGRRVGCEGYKGGCKTDIPGFGCWHPRWVIDIYFNNWLVMSRCVEVARAPGAIHRWSAHKYAVPSNHV